MSNYTFVDLFAGIGGFRLAFERAGFKCVFSSEWDKFCQQTYSENFGEVPCGDIRKLTSSAIPDHDVLVAGFPCQPFSISGVSKKRSLNRPTGFEDETEGTLFFEVKRILRDKKPQAFVLENVKNLKSHDKGRTFPIIMNTLHELGYLVEKATIDARNVVPQHRERIFIVGFRRWIPFRFPEWPKRRLQVGDILDDEVDPKYTLSSHLWAYLQDYANKHKAAGNGFGFGLVRADDLARTLSARYHKDGSEILVKQLGKNPRRLTPRECARLMGFPEYFKIPVSDTQAYRQFGNAVVVPVAEAIARNLLKAMKRGEKFYGNSYSMDGKNERSPYMDFESAHPFTKSISEDQQHFGEEVVP